MEKSILYDNACVRKDSRTRKLAERLLIKLGEPYDEICLENTRFPVINEEYLNKRDRLISTGDFQNDIGFKDLFRDLLAEFTDKTVNILF